jgi:hypothetical protein
MKTRKLLFVSGLLMLSFISNAQDIRWGLKAGANFSTINTEGTAATYASRTGIHAGLLAHIHLNKSWAIQPELVYSLQGGKSDLPGGGTQSINLNYINVPVLVQYMFDNGFRLQTGPQAGFLVQANRKTGNSSVSLTDTYNKTDFSWAFGAGYLSNIGLGLDVRYNLGLTDAYKLAADKQKNNVVQVGLFYMFKHKSK